MRFVFITYSRTGGDRLSMFIRGLQWFIKSYKAIIYFCSTIVKI